MADFTRFVGAGEAGRGVSDLEYVGKKKYPSLGVFWG